MQRRLRHFAELAAFVLKRKEQEFFGQAGGHEKLALGNGETGKYRLRRKKQNCHPRRASTATRSERGRGSSSSRATHTHKISSFVELWKRHRLGPLPSLRSLRERSSP